MRKTLEQELILIRFTGLAVVSYAGKQCTAVALKRHVRERAALYKVPKIVSLQQCVLGIAL